MIETGAGGETFLDRMLGTNCYSQAVKDLQKDCKNMDQDVKTRLALRLANCQRATQGESTFPCSNEEPLRKCMERLPERVYELYVEFLTHADSMCLFIEHRDFEKYTETMLNRLSEGAGYAKMQLATIGQQTTDLAISAHTIVANTKEALSQIEDQRLLQFKNIEELRRHSAEAVELHSDLTARQQAAITLGKEALEAQTQLKLAQGSLMSTLLAGREQVESALALAAQRSEALAAAQEASKQAQISLKTQLEALSDGSKGLKTAVDAVAMYQQRSDAALTRLLGRSYSLEDAAFYGAGALAGLSTGVTRATQPARFPILALFAASLVAERAAVDRFHMFLEVNAVGEIVARVPIPRWMAVFGVVQDDPLDINVKWAVRRMCVSLGLCVVLWCWLSYKDYERHNHRLLSAMEEEQKLLPKRFELQLQDELRNHRIELLRLMGSGNGGGGGKKQNQYGYDHDFVDHHPFGNPTTTMAVATTREHVNIQEPPDNNTEAKKPAARDRRKSVDKTSALENMKSTLPQMPPTNERNGQALGLLPAPGTIPPPERQLRRQSSNATTSNLTGSAAASPSSIQRRSKRRSISRAPSTIPEERRAPSRSGCDMDMDEASGETGPLRSTRSKRTGSQQQQQGDDGRQGGANKRRKMTRATK